MGYPHPDHLLSSLTAKQFREWQEFYRVEPFGDSLIDSRLADLSCMFANANFKKEDGKPFIISDFAPYLEQEKPKIVDLGPEENARLIEAQINACMRA